MSSYAAGSSAAVKKTLPRALIFDLDGCVWEPEMYDLWGRGGGAPFTRRSDGDLTDRNGNHIYLLADVRQILRNLKTDTKWANVIIGVASKCDKPSWAKECIDKFEVGDGIRLSQVFSASHTEIYGGRKDLHFEELQKKIKGSSMKDFIFFDNQYDNCAVVSKLGVTVVYTPDGVTKQLFDEAIDKFPAPREIIGHRRTW